MFSPQVESPNPNDITTPLETFAAAPATKSRGVEKSIHHLAKDFIAG